MDDKKNQEIQIQVIDLRVIESSILPYSDIDTEETEIKTYGFYHAINVGFEIDRELVHINIGIKIHPNNSKEPAASFVIRTTYTIKNMINFIRDDEKIDLPKDLIMFFVNNAIASTRGVISALLMPTEYHKAILPLTNGKELFDQMEFK